MLGGARSFKAFQINSNKSATDGIQTLDSGLCAIDPDQLVTPLWFTVYFYENDCNFERYQNVLLATNV